MRSDKSSVPYPQQGTGGTTLTTDQAHLDWIAEYVANTPHLRGMCLPACHDMLEKFPDLKLVRGWAIPPACAEAVSMYQLDPGDGHYWLETQDGKVVDPTRGQFEREDIYYLAFDETKAETLPTGKCPNDGWYCYRGNFFCSWGCEVDYRKYMEGEGAVFDVQDYKSICPNPDCQSRSTKPVPNKCVYCQADMVDLPVVAEEDLSNGDVERDLGSHGRKT